MSFSPFARYADEDEAYDRSVQREIDDAAESLRAYEARRDAPKPQACTFCDNVFAGAVCNLCKEERPSYTALKSMSAKKEAA